MREYCAAFVSFLGCSVLCIVAAFTARRHVVSNLTGPHAEGQGKHWQSCKGLGLSRKTGSCCRKLAAENLQVNADNHAQLTLGVVTSRRLNNFRCLHCCMLSNVGCRGQGQHWQVCWLKKWPGGLLARRLALTQSFATLKCDSGGGAALGLPCPRCGAPWGQRRLPGTASGTLSPRACMSKSMF